VTDLNLFGCELDLYATLSLPRLFPNLRRLDFWQRGGGYEAIEDTDFPSKKHYQSQLKRWKYIERIKAITNEMIPISLLLIPI
jgi:hypothetical protein